MSSLRAWWRCRVAKVHRWDRDPFGSPQSYFYRVDCLDCDKSFDAAHLLAVIAQISAIGTLESQELAMTLRRRTEAGWHREEPRRERA